MAEMPSATVEVSIALVRRLVRDQRPDLDGGPIVRVANGWDNATFRLGDGLAVRLPRLQGRLRKVRDQSDPE